MQCFDGIKKLKTEMMKQMKKILGLSFFTLSFLWCMGQTAPPPNNGNTSSGGTTPVGGGAPIAGGLLILVSAGLAYGVGKTLLLKKNLEETVK